MAKDQGSLHGGVGRRALEWNSEEGWLRSQVMAFQAEDTMGVQATFLEQDSPNLISS